MRANSALIFIFLLLYSISAGAQGVNTDFGQNRLRQKPMDWQILSSENADAFFYEGGKNLAAYALLTAEENIKKIETFFDYRVGGKVEIILFNSIEDLRQSNTGLKEQQFNVGGYTYVIDNKVIAYFNGDHADFEKQIKNGIAEIILSEMIYGGSLQERVQSSSLLFLPQWFFKGLTSYVSQPWGPEMDSKVRDGILSGKYAHFNWLDEDDAVIAGHSIWNYIVNKYGAKNIPEILYYTRISKGYEAAFLYTLRVSSSRLFEEWVTYYQTTYSETESDRTVPRKLLNIPEKVSGYPHTQIRTHPNGRRVAFVMNKNGFWQVKIYDKRDKQEHTVLKGGKQEGYQVINYTYPIIAWEPAGHNLGIIYYEAGKTKLVKIDRDRHISARYIINGDIDQVLSFDFLDNKTIVLSAIKNGQSDLYEYQLESKKLTQITDDIYDDLWPRFNNDRSRLIFSSNRDMDSLTPRKTVFTTISDSNNFDIYVYDFDAKNPVLKRITNTKGVNETQPVFYLNGYYSFLSDISGIINAYACADTTVFSGATVVIRYTNGKTDTLKSLLWLNDTLQGKAEINGITYEKGDSIDQVQVKNNFLHEYNYYPLTNYKRNILSRDLATTDDAEYNLLLYNNTYNIFETNMFYDVKEESKDITIVPTEYRLRTKLTFYYGKNVPEKTVIVLPESHDNVDTAQNNPAIQYDSVRYHFQTDFPEGFSYNKLSKKSKPKNEFENDILNGIGKPQRLFSVFFPDYYVTQVDNSIAHTYYHLNGTHPSPFANMNIMVQVKTAMTDLLGNHKISAGLRIPLSLSGSDYFMNYENRKHRINWSANYFRQSRRTNGVSSFTRMLINEFRLGFKLPFNETVSLRTYFFARQDRNILLGIDSASVKQQDQVYTWLGNKTELVVDNTKNIDINLPYGTRFKLFAEFYNNINAGNQNLINIGIDYRRYIKLHKKIIWANRLSANTSVGAAKVMYFVGGVENWVSPNFDRTILTATGSQYIFQSIASGIRGFKQNIRNGSNYAILNSELRFPVASYVTQKPVRADILRNFLIVPFVDVGSAWYGASPFSEQPYNTRYIDQGSVKVSVTSRNAPLVGGFGIGGRTRVFGYYVRLDFAWGVANGQVGDKVTYFSFGYDF